MMRVKMMGYNVKIANATMNGMAKMYPYLE